jgi:hypothetical protein
MAREQQNLVLGRRVEEHLRREPCPLRVEVHEHVVHHERQRHGQSAELCGKRETQAQVELLRRAPAQ